MSCLHLIEEHHQIIPSLQNLSCHSHTPSLESFGTILHFDSHSDVGDIRTSNRLPDEFLDPTYPFLENLHVGNPFTLLFHYGILKDFFWFSPDTDCKSVCCPHVFSTIFSQIDEIYHYSRSLRPCIDDLYCCKTSSESFYRRLSIDSDSNLDFVLNSLDYAVIDTGLRESIFLDKPYVLDICLDYFCCNFVQYSNPIRLSVTDDFFHEFIANPLHPLKLKLGPLARPITINNQYFIDIGGFDSPSPSDNSSIYLPIIETRLTHFLKFISSFRSIPQHIYICRSRLSNYTPYDLVDNLEQRLIVSLQQIFPIDILDESNLFGISSQ